MYRLEKLCAARKYSKFARLFKSDEAKRQLRMGHILDPAHPIAKPVTILEQIFDDQNIFDSSENIFAPTRHPFVQPETSWAQNPSQIKGLKSTLVASMFSKQLIRKCGTKQEFLPIASAYYFPPWHPVSQGRKSRPALVALRGPGEQFNGNEEARAYLKARKSQKSMNPMDYAVWRVKTARLFRKALFKHCQHDGVYVFTMRRVPTAEQADKIVSEFVQKVSQSDLNWAEKQANSLDLANMDDLLEQANYQSMEKRLKREYWNTKRPSR